jgi:NhaA family Na+:H+ antiporter
MKGTLGQLPKETADLFTRPLTRFLRIEAMAGAVLLLCTVVALVLSNTIWSAQFLGFWETKAGLVIGEIEFSRSFKHWINDGLMTLFFFVVALELKRELVLGELCDPRRAAFPLAAALGGMVVPAGLFLLLLGDAPGARGWGTVMSTDTAFVIGCLAVLGARLPHSLRLFLLSLAIFDDVGAILLVAIAYGGDLNWTAIGLVALGLAVVAGTARLGIRSIPVYFAMGGLIWLALDASGVHATLAGVILGLMTPARSWVSDSRLHAIFDRVVAHPPGAEWSGNTPARHDLRRASIAAREALSPIERLEMSLHPWVAFTIMPLFALANAGVPIGATGFEPALAMSIFVAFVVGKPIGIVLFSALAVRMRLGTRPSDLPWSLLAAGSLLTGIGFTMALFIAELAFDPGLLNSAKLGILAASVVSAAIGFLALVCMTGRTRRISAGL